MSFNGKAVVTVESADGEVSIANQAYDSASNLTTADLVVPAGSKGLMVLMFTNSQRTATSPLNSGITHLRVTRPGYAHSTTQIFHTPFLDMIASAPLNHVRAMDYTLVNHKEPDYPGVTEWSMRNLDSDATWSDNPLRIRGGASWENVIALANATNKHLWINVPVSATTDYVTQLATLLKNNLNSGLEIYLESSNEVWNGSFKQSDWNAQQANDLFSKARGGVNETKNHARRTVELVNIFAGVFGQSAINSRIKAVWGWQSGCCLTNFDWGLQYITDTFGPPSNFLTAVHGTTYYNPSGATSTATPEQILQAMSQNSDDSRSIRSELNAKADQWNLQYWCYEGGPDTGGGSTTNVGNRILAERLPAHGPVLEKNVRDNFFNLGGDMYTHYMMVASAYSRYGCWGLTDDATNPDRNAKFQAIRNLIDSGGGTPCTATAAHVDSITVTTVSAGQGKKRGQATVVVKDDCGNPVASATVSGSFSGSIGESGLAITNSSGTAVITTTNTASGSVSITFCVNSVTHASLPYDSASNVETCDSN